MMAPHLVEQEIQQDKEQNKKMLGQRLGKELPIQEKDGDTMIELEKP